MNDIINLNNYYVDRYDFSCNNIKQLSKNIYNLKQKLKVVNVFEFAEKIGYKISSVEMDSNNLCKVSNNEIFLNNTLDKKRKSTLIAIVITNFLLDKKQTEITIENYMAICRDKDLSDFLTLLLIDGKTYLDIFKSLVPLKISMDKAFEILEECFDVSYFIAIKRYNMIIEEGV